MEIASIPMTRLAVASKIHFVDDIISVITTNDAALLKVENHLLALKSRWQELSALYRVDVKNPLTQEIFNLDMQRDACLYSIWHLIKGHSSSPIDAKKQAGKKLSRNFSLYASSPSAFIKQKYKEETNNISSLLSGWNADPQLMDAVDVLGISDVTTALTEINNLHNQKLLERNSMYAAQTTDTSKQKQAEMAFAYNDLCKTLNSLAYLTPTPLYDKTIREINSLIRSEVLSLKQKAGRKKEEISKQV